MKRFLVWVFGVLFYAYAVSTGLFGDGSGRNALVILAGIVLLVWPVCVFLAAFVLPRKEPPWTR